MLEDGFSVRDWEQELGGNQLSKNCVKTRVDILGRPIHNYKYFKNKNASFLDQILLDKKRYTSYFGDKETQDKARAAGEKLLHSASSSARNTKKPLHFDRKWNEHVKLTEITAKDVVGPKLTNNITIDQGLSLPYIEEFHGKPAEEDPDVYQRQWWVKLGRSPRPVVTSQRYVPPLPLSPNELASLSSPSSASSFTHYAASAPASARTAKTNNTRTRRRKFMKPGGAKTARGLLQRSSQAKTPVPPSVLANLPSNWRKHKSALQWKRRAANRLPANSKPAHLLNNGNVDNAKEPQPQMALPKGYHSYHRPYDSVSETHGFLSQHNIQEILRKTRYNRRELYVLFNRFKALCSMSSKPHGIDKETFKKGVARLAVEDDLFVDRVFDAVDDDRSGEIEWPEFVAAMSALEKGKPALKARFFFQIYDIDQDDYISKQDLSLMFNSSSMLKDDDTTREVVETFVNKIFKLFGREEEGRISLQDVLTYIENDPEQQDVWSLFGRSMLK